MKLISSSKESHQRSMLPDAVIMEWFDQIINCPCAVNIGIGFDAYLRVYLNNKIFGTLYVDEEMLTFQRFESHERLFKVCLSDPLCFDKMISHLQHLGVDVNVNAAGN